MRFVEDVDGIMASAANEAFAVTPDEHVLVIPFGDYPVTIRKGGQPMRVLQRIDADSAAVLAASVNSWIGQATRGFSQLPIYAGHPDYEGTGDRDKRAYGWVERAAVNDSDLTLYPAWNSLGDAVLSDRQYRFHSPHFLLKETGERSQGLPVCRPVCFRSFGLTNTPNIPVPAINETNMEEDSMNLLNRLLALIGREDIKTEDDVVSAVQNMVGALKKVREAAEARYDAEWAADRAVNEIPTEELATDLIDRLVAAANSSDEAVTAAQELLAAANTQHAEDSGALSEQLSAANARVAELELAATALQDSYEVALDAAINEGRILSGDREAWLARFPGEVVPAINEMAALTPAMNTESQLGDQQGRAQNGQSPSELFIAAVNSHMGEHGVPWSVAWAAVRDSRPDLASALHQPRRTYSEKS